MAEKLDKAREEVAEAQKRIDEITEKIAAHKQAIKNLNAKKKKLDVELDEAKRKEHIEMLQEF